MSRRIDSDAQALWQLYQKLGSLRAVSRETGISHMVVRRRLVEAGFQLRERTPNPQAMNPSDKVYLRPRQIEAIERLARRRGVTRHAMARELLDRALDQFAEEILDEESEREAKASAVA